jgi:hypothetical protein
MTMVVSNGSGCRLAIPSGTGFYKCHVNLCPVTVKLLVNVNCIVCFERVHIQHFFIVDVILLYSEPDLV